MDNGGPLARQTLPTAVEIYLRVLGRDLVRAAMLLLASWARKCYPVMPAEGMGRLKSRDRFMERNVELQKELDRFYGPYHYLCPPCDACCCAVKTPYESLDMILYGISGEPAVDWNFSGHLKVQFNHYLNVVQRWITGGQPETSPEISKEPRSTECFHLNGCIIPLGQRPAYCIFIPCGRFLKYMDRPRYWRCMRLSLKYLRFLTISLMAVMAEWRQQVRGPHR